MYIYEKTKIFWTIFSADIPSTWSWPRAPQNTPVLLVDEQDPLMSRSSSTSTEPVISNSSYVISDIPESTLLNMPLPAHDDLDHNNIIPDNTVSIEICLHNRLIIYFSKVWSRFIFKKSFLSSVY